MSDDLIFDTVHLVVLGADVGVGGLGETSSGVQTSSLEQVPHVTVVGAIIQVSVPGLGRGVSMDTARSCGRFRERKLDVIDVKVDWRCVGERQHSCCLTCQIVSALLPGATVCPVPSRNLLDKLVHHRGTVHLEHPIEFTGCMDGVGIYSGGTSQDNEDDRRHFLMY